MLVAQAKAAAERFLDAPIPDGQVEEITAQMERETQNLLLIGMPGCGKTTVGRVLAQRLGRTLVDTDALVVQAAGCPIPELFAREGEEAFRALEHQALCQAGRPPAPSSPPGAASSPGGRTGPPCGRTPPSSSCGGPWTSCPWTGGRVPGQSPGGVV